MTASVYGHYTSVVIREVERLDPREFRLEHTRTR